MKRLAYELGASPATGDYFLIAALREVPEGHPQTRSHLAQFDTVGFRAIFA